METFTQSAHIESDLPSTPDSDVTLGKSATPQSALGKEPIAGEADVTVKGHDVQDGKTYLDDCQTLTAMALRRAYPGEAVCHRKMLERLKAQGLSSDTRLHRFCDFLARVKPKPIPTATLDRRFNDNRDYTFENVRWADKITQTNNRGCTILLQPPGGGPPLTVGQASKRLKVPTNTIHVRRRRGWTDNEILSGKRSPTSAVVQTPNIEPDHLGHVWTRSMLGTYPGEDFVLSGAEKGMLKTFAKDCPDASEVLSYAIKNWFDFTQKVRFDHGRHRDSLPDRPDPVFLLKYIRCARNLYLKGNNLIIGEDLRVHAGPSEEEQAAASSARYREDNDRLLGRVPRVQAEPDLEMQEKDDL
jgi:hypothetical protein